MRLTELHEDLAAIRLDLAAELDAITRLESQTFTLHDEQAREAVRHIADDKKAHAGTLLRLVERLDPKFAVRPRETGS